MDDQRFHLMDGLGPKEDFREPPCNLEAEQALLGSLLVNSRDVLLKVRHVLEPEMFYEPVHGEIYEHICKLDDQNQEATPVKLGPYFKGHAALVDLGDAAYLVRLAASAATIINAEDYAGTIRDLAMRRSVIIACEGAVNDAYDAPIDTKAMDIVETVETAMHGLHREASKGHQTIRDTVTATRDAFARIDEARKHSGIVGLTTGIHSLDKATGGLKPSTLYVLAGDTSMGKSGLANHIAFAAARGQKTPGAAPEPVGGLFISQEMDAEENIYRAISAEINVEHQRSVEYFRIQDGKYNDLEAEWVNAARERVEGVPITWIDQSGLTPSRIRMIAKRAQRDFERRGLKLGFIVVDYLQQLKADEKCNGLFEEVTKVSNALLALAKELRVPVVALSQLSRMDKSRTNKRPKKSDLRQSGAIEQDAAVIIFVYREEYYLGEEEPMKGTSDHVEWQAKMDRVSGRLELILGKNRHGPKKTIHINAVMATNYFNDPNPQEELFNG